MSLKFLAQPKKRGNKMKRPVLSSFRLSSFRSVIRFPSKILVPEILNLLTLVVHNCTYIPRNLRVETTPHISNLTLYLCAFFPFLDFSQAKKSENVEKMSRIIGTSGSLFWKRDADCSTYGFHTFFRFFSYKAKKVN